MRSISTALKESPARRHAASGSFDAAQFKIGTIVNYYPKPEAKPAARHVHYYTLMPAIEGHQPEYRIKFERIAFENELSAE